jgi:Protein of unknown function (DUF2516)
MFFLLAGGMHGVMYIVQLVVSVVVIAALTDAAIRKGDLYVAADKQTKPFWIMLLVVCLLVGFAGVAGGLVYLIDVRPALIEADGGTTR